MTDGNGRSAQAYLQSLLIPPPAEQNGLEAMERPRALEVADIMPAVMPPGADTALIESTAEKVVRGEALAPPEQMALEAIIIPDKRPAIDIVNNDFSVAHPLWQHLQTDAAIHQGIVRALPSVGRIELPGNFSTPYGGTGFVVGPDLIMTNRHVAAIFADGWGTAVTMQAGAKAGLDFHTEPGGSDFLEVRQVVLIHPFWDMALLRVGGLAGGDAPLDLDLTAIDDLTGRDVVVIGYPAFDPRNDAGVQNEVFRGRYGIKRLQPGKLAGRVPVASFGKSVPATTHDSSTLGGNSGSVVLDAASGKVIALHFGGIYKVRNYAVPICDLGKDGRVIDAGVAFPGTPVRGPTAWDDWWQRADGREQPASVPDDSGTASTPLPPAATRGSGRIIRATIPIEIEIRIGDVATDLSVTASPATFATERAAEVAHDDISMPRRGYDADFLGVAVPLPEALDLALVAKLEDGGHVVPYHHFSLVMHKQRRLALFAAANVDAAPARKQPEPGHDYTRKGLSGLGDGDIERWFEDPRLRGTDQLPDRFFEKDNKAFDKGHLVRRDDVAWGRTFAEVRAANGDTYHTTNCSPQIAGFNRSDHDLNWGALEDVIFKQAKTERYCLFSGPVLAEDDPQFLGVDSLGKVTVQIPRTFWKVVVAVQDGALRSYGFELKQDLSATPLIEFAVPDHWKDSQIALTDLEAKLCWVRFPDAVRKADQFGVVA
jgi:endonuclease G